jgi:protocatechuate 3,4-dioxygenase beta subunit
MDRHIDRRQALAVLGGVSLGTLLAACGGSGAEATTAEVATTTGATATVEPQAGSDLAALFDDDKACTVTAELTEGPYYFDVDSIRRDIREDREGARLRLGVRVRDAGTCSPIESAVVDVWHCDADGTYSGFESASMGGAGGGRTDEETYLRGAQVTNAAGIAELVTIYPGWYRGRAVHIHAKVHVDSSTVLTTQFFFDDDFSTKVYEAEPYASNGPRDQLNESDGIYEDGLLLDLSEEEGGYVGLITLDVRTA